jgi:hypothetical protein
MAFRTTLAGDGADFNGADDGDDGGIELPECIVVTTEPEDATGGSHEQPINDDFGLPGSDSGESSGTDGGAPQSGDDRGAPQGGDSSGGDSSGGDPASGGDDYGLPPEDPSAASGLACPGEGKLVTVEAPNPDQAEAICARYYSHCCESVCAFYGLEPEPQASCAIDADDPYISEGGLEDVSDPAGNYACGCECQDDLIIVIP